MTPEQVMQRHYMQSVMLACTVAGFAAGGGNHKDALPPILEHKLKAVLPTFSEIQIQELILEAMACMDKFIELSGHFDPIEGDIQ